MKLVGHEEQRRFLDRLSEKSALPQSFLFSGPRSVGKKLVAYEFAVRLVGGQDGSFETHPDILTVCPESETATDGKVKRKKISVEQVRTIILFLSRYPTLGKRRVVIIDDAEELTQEAENALLKILEEPNSTSVLIVVTHQPGKLLPTTLSRLAPVIFDTVPEKDLCAFFSSSDRSAIPDFFFSLGMPGLIVKALREPEGFRGHQELLRELFRVSKLSLRERLHLADTLAQNEVFLPDLLTEWLMGLHVRMIGMPTSIQQQKLLLLLDRFQKEFRPLLARQGNTKLLLEKLLLPL